MKKMQLLKTIANRDPSWRVAIASLGLFGLAACATMPPPTAELRAAEQAIANAEQARVADYASPELTAARDKLGAARTAVEQHNMLLAQRLAEQSRLDAELATAKAAAAKSMAVNDEMRKSTEALRQEMQRSPGAQK